MLRRPLAAATLVVACLAATADADEGTTQLLAGHHAAGVPQPGYLDWIGTTGIDGRGVKVSIVDTGVDPGHPDLDDRAVEEINYETAPNVLGDVDELGHGTHVAGIVAGRPDVDEPTAFRDVDGFLYGMGVAPGTELISQNGLGAGQLVPEESLAEMIPMLARDAVRSAAVAWNASWHTGEGSGAGYRESARLVDGLVRDADGETAGLQPLIMVFSAGNAGDGEHTLTAPKEAKNLIAVASSKGQRASGTTEEISSFSSRGPSRDGRVVPTVTAPGEVIASARSKPLGGLCFGPADVSPVHSTCSGTSMAAPHVTGAVALVTQWWRGFNGGATPSPAMAKALLVNTAVDLGDPDIPNGNEGWGRVDLGGLLRPAERIYADQQQAFTEAGDAHSWRVRPVDPTRPMRITVAWTDAPGTAVPERPSDEDLAKPVLVNDLDLTVTGPGGTFLGNRFEAGRSVAGGQPNRLDNVENVFLPTGGDGEHIVTVGAHALNGDGVPGAGDASDQDYAIVISNARIAPAPPAALAAPVPAARVKIFWAKRRTSRRISVRLRAVNAPLRSVRIRVRSGRRTLATRRLARLGTAVRTVTVRLRRRAPRRLQVVVTATSKDRSVVRGRYSLRTPRRAARS